MIQSQTAFFADDGKIFANPLIKSGQLQEDLNCIQAWARDWIIKLNAAKCTVLHLGSANPRAKYRLDNSDIESVDLQKDLGVLIASNLKWEDQIISIVKKANSFLYVIRRSFQLFTVEVFLKIYKTYIRPLLEYGFQVWSPYFQKDINLLESVQRKATKLPQVLRHKSYEERLLTLRLTSLEERRLRGDLIETFKIINQYYNLPNIEDIYIIRESSRPNRGHKIQLTRDLAKTKPAHHFLSNRVVHNWNKLPEHVVSATSINNFKNKLDKWLSTEKKSLLKL